MKNNTAKKWDVFEVTVQGPSEGNPFIEHFVKGVFQGKNETVTVDGFYDGDGNYKVRFMPSFEGEYCYRIEADFMEAKEGKLLVDAAAENNHGPVRVANEYHFVYEDGMPYYSIGTTCYVWALQSDERIQETMDSLKQSGFNKIRFCIFQSIMLIIWENQEAILMKEHRWTAVCLPWITLWDLTENQREINLTLPDLIRFISDIWRIVSGHWKSLV